MSIEEEAHFADLLVAAAIDASGGSFSVAQLQEAQRSFAALVSTDAPTAEWSLVNALVRLTLEIYMSGELDETVEGCLREALRVVGNAIDDAAS